MTKYRLQSLLFVFVAFMLGCNEYMIVGVLPDIAKDFMPRFHHLAIPLLCLH